MRLACAPLLLTAACAIQYGDDPPPPVTGPTHRFIVDSIDLPKTNNQAREMGDDLNGDRVVDNQIGMILATLNSQGDVTTHGVDMIAAGAIASSVEIVADDLRNDGTVAVTYRGADGDAADAVTGAMTDGWFRSARTTSSSPLGRTTVKLPVYVDADPISLELESLEIDLQPDGAGGYDGYLRGAVDARAAKHAAYLGGLQMISANPHDHVLFMSFMDSNPHDWTMTEDEWNHSNIILSFFEPDVTIRGRAMLSFGFRVHLRACDGDCALPPPADRCHDRVIDQFETGVDCGETTCRTCEAGQSCASGADCESGQCSGGLCRSPSCTDGIRDGFETEVDCGANCNGCALGDDCYDDDDCPAGRTCGTPCSGSLCFPSLATCQ
jgi:hypothetical protein